MRYRKTRYRANNKDFLFVEVTDFRQAPLALDGKVDKDEVLRLLIEKYDPKNRLVGLRTGERNLIVENPQIRAVFYQNIPSQLPNQLDFLSWMEEGEIVYL